MEVEKASELDIVKKEERLAIQHLGMVIIYFLTNDSPVLLSSSHFMSK